VLSLRGRLAWAHDWVSDPALTPLFQTLPARASSSTAPSRRRTPRSPPRARSIRLANGITLLGKFDGEFAARSSTCAGTSTVRYSW
jgi:hypothetical protein